MDVKLCLCSIAVKCNDDDRVVKTLADLGTSFDCASKNEIKKVLDLGVEPERIIFANPCKPVSHLEYAKENNVLASTVDTEFEIYKIHKNYPESRFAKCLLTFYNSLDNMIMYIL